MPKKRTVINLNAPKVEGNKVFLSWERSPLFQDSNYWIEYKDLKNLDCQPETLLETYLPICLALSFLGNVTIKLPGYVSATVLETWYKICRDTTRALGKMTANIEFTVSAAAIKDSFRNKNKNFSETALLFGGGSESLLPLAHLTDEKISPYLVSLWGAGWVGSDPNNNRERFNLEEDIRRVFRLRIIRIHTNLRTLFHTKYFKPYLRHWLHKLYIIDAALALPMYISLILPAAAQFNIGNIISGNEKEYTGDLHYYSYSREMTRNLLLPSRFISYRSELENLTKLQVIQQLHQKYPHFAKYQYSCFSAIHQRWCLKCEKCLRNYLVYKIFDTNPLNVGMDEAIILQNIPNIILEVKKKCRHYKALFLVWSGIRDVAINREKKEVLKIINSFYPESLRNIFLNIIKR